MSFFVCEKNTFSTNDENCMSLLASVHQKRNIVVISMHMPHIYVMIIIHVKLKIPFKRAQVPSHFPSKDFSVFFYL